MNQPQPTAQTGNILVVDDTPANLRLLAGMLAQHGYKVRPVPSGMLALNAAQAAPPDLILLDITMPGLNGYDVCQQLKSQPDTRGIPVIFISALDEALDKVRAFAVGGVDYITKPFQMEEVLARVENQLMIRALQQQLEHQVGELQHLNKRLQSELALARDVQQSLLPPPNASAHAMSIVCHTQPAQDVGGDFYSYAALSDQRFAVCVGDVSGKGVSAALLMAASLSQFDALLMHDLSPGELLAQLDHGLLPYTKPRRQNCALCYVELSRGVLRTVNAGGMAPYVRRATGGVQSLEVGGLPLGQGMVDHEPYQEAVLTLQEGDLVILTSDGIVEAINQTGTLFGFTRLEQAIASGPTSSAEAMLAHLWHAVATFSNGQEPHDDMTIVIVQV